MIKKKNLLKNLLATASTMAVLASGIQSASAIDYHTQADAQFDGAGAADLYNDTAGADRGAVDVAAGDTIKYTGDHTLAANKAVAGAGVTLDLNGQAALGDVTVTAATTFAALNNVGAAKLNFDVQEATIITAAKNSVGTVVFNHNNTLTIADQFTTGGAITTGTNNEGTLDLTHAAGVATVDHTIGAVGGHSLKVVNFAGGAAINADISSTAINVAAGKTATVKAGVTLEGELNGGAAASSTLNLAGGLTLIKGANADVLSGNFNAIELSAVKLLTIKSGDVTAANGLKMTGSTLTAGEDGNVTINKITLADDASKIVAKANNVTVTEFVGDKKVAAQIDGAANLKLDAETLKGVEKATFAADGTLTLNAAAATDLDVLDLALTTADNGNLDFTGVGTVTLKSIKQDKRLNVATGNAATVIGTGQTLEAKTVAGTFALADDAILKGKDITADITQVAGAAASTLEGDVTGSVTLSVKDSVLTVDGSYVKAGVATISAADTATFKLKTTKEADIKMGGADARLILDLTDATGKVKLTANAVRGNKVMLKGDTVLELQDDITNTMIVAEGNGHKIVAKTNQALGHAVPGMPLSLGTADQGLNFHTDGDKTLAFVGGNANYFVNVSTETTNEGVVTLAASGDPAATVNLTGTLGANGKVLKEVNFDNYSVYTGEAFATKYTQAANADVTLEGATLHGEYDLQARAGKLRLNDSTLDKLSNAGTADVYVSGTSHASGDWGLAGAKVQLVEVATNSKLIMADGKTLHATKLDLKDGARWYIGGDVTMTDVTMAADSAVNTNGHKLTVGAGNTYTNDAGFAISIAASQAGKISHGELVFNAASMADIKGKSLKIVAEAAADTADYEAGELAFDKVVDVTALSDAQKVDFKAAFGVKLDGEEVITYTAFTNPTEAAAEAEKAAAVTPATPKEVARVAKLVAAAEKAGVDVSKLVPAAVTNEDKVVEAQARALTAEDSSASAAAMTMAGVTDAVSNAASMAVDTRIAAAAGDDSIPYGAWLSAIGGQATQKSTSKTPVGYKSNVFGGTIGWDAEVAEGTMVGLAGTYAKGNVKLKDSKVGDKADTKTMMVNLYAQQNISDDMFVQGMVGYAQTDVKAKSKRVLTNTTYETVNSKYKVKGYSAKLLGGYSMAVGNGVSFTPMAGVKFGKLDQGSVTEKGAATNLASSVKHKNKITGVVGARVATVVDSGNMVLTPEAHAFLDYNLGSKKAAVSKIGVAADTARVSQTIEHASKYAVNVGTSVTAKSGMMEYGVGYDASIAKKYVGHQGSLKVRVNF